MEENFSTLCLLYEWHDDIIPHKLRISTHSQSTKFTNDLVRMRDENEKKKSTRIELVVFVMNFEGRREATRIQEMKLKNVKNGRCVLAYVICTTLWMHTTRTHVGRHSIRRRHSDCVNRGHRHSPFVVVAVERMSSSIVSLT